MKMTQKTYKDLTSNQKKQIIKELESTANMAAFLDHLNIYFDLEKCQPGAITKAILSNQMVNIVLPMINPNLNEL